MSDSIESMRRPPLEDVLLPAEDLHPDPMNPNHLSDRRMAALKRDIERGSFFRPVVVRPRDPTDDDASLRGSPQFTITDGEHRWRILRELGEAKIPCVIDDAGDTEGRIRNLTLNMLHGKPDPVREANLLVEIAAKTGEDELREAIGMGEEEYTDVVALQDAGADLDAAMAKALEREDADAPEVLRWKLGPRQAQVVERALDSLADGGMGRAEALIKVLEGRS